MPAALIRRFHEAKTKNLPTVTVWGTGTLRREFLYGDDLADSCVFAIKHYSDLAHRAICSTFEAQRTPTNIALLSKNHPINGIRYIQGILDRN